MAHFRDGIFETSRIIERHSSVKERFERAWNPRTLVFYSILKFSLWFGRKLGSVALGGVIKPWGERDITNHRKFEKARRKAEENLEEKKCKKDTLF